MLTSELLYVILVLEILCSKFQSMIVISLLQIDKDMKFVALKLALFKSGNHSKDPAIAHCVIFFSKIMFWIKTSLFGRIG